MRAHIASLHVGKPAESFTYNGKPVLTGMVKDLVIVPIMLTPLGFEGDGQADQKHHGGPDKAVCVFAEEHYTYWSEEIGRPLPSSAFGENLTTSGLVESDVHIGDTFRIGEAVVQVSQPRQPCFKLAARYDHKELPIWMQNTGYTGYYLRVLEPGRVTVGDPIELLSREPSALSIQYANEVMHQKLHGAEGIERLLAVPALSSSWRASLSKRLLGAQESTDARIKGSE
ncbi:MOSC domain-containing protein [Paenibacillus marinisediminis]